MQLSKLERCDDAHLLVASWYLIDGEHLNMGCPLCSSLQCDYSLVHSNLWQLEAMCKASWEQLKMLDKADEKRKGGKWEKIRSRGGDEALLPEGSLRQQLPKILKECEGKLKVLKAVHRRVINRWVFFLRFD